MRPVTPIGLIAEHLRTAAGRLGGEEDPVLVTELCAARDLARGMEAYITDCTSPEPAILAELAQRTCERRWEEHRGPVTLEAEMLSGHVEGAALGMIAGLSGARRVLEIGMFTGYATVALAAALPADGRVVACEIDAEVAAEAEENFAACGLAERIDVRVGPARETLRALAEAGERFDLVFLDADKAGYVDYLSAVLDDRLLAPDGVLLADNTLLQGEPWLPGEPSANGAAIARFNATLAGDPRVEQVLLGVRDGLTLVRWAR